VVSFSVMHVRTDTCVASAICFEEQCSLFKLAWSSRGRAVLESRKFWNHEVAWLELSWHWKLSDSSRALWSSANTPFPTCVFV
jgi:hypothetical protein